MPTPTPSASFKTYANAASSASSSSATARRHTSPSTAWPAAATTASKGARESWEAKKLKEVEKELAARGKGGRPKDVYWEGARARASEAATGHEAVEEARLIRQDNPRLKYIEFLFDSCAFID